MALDDNALITLADTKVYLNEDSSNFDTILEMLINSISTLFDTYTDRDQLKEKTDTTLYLDGNGEREINLPRWPITSITAVTEDDLILTEGKDEDYILYTEEGYLYKNGGDWTKNRKGIKLSSYKAGFATVPKDLQLACMKQVAKEWKRQDKQEWGEASRSFGEGSISISIDELLDDVKATLDRYRRL